MCYMFSSGGLFQFGKSMAAPDTHPAMMFRHCWRSSLKEKNQFKITILLTNTTSSQSEQLFAKNKRFFCTKEERKRHCL